MTTIVWDAVGAREFQVGVDRGVLYPTSGPGVAWNGLTSVEENNTKTLNSKFLDGRKFLEYVTVGDYSATLNAFTYPAELDAINGIYEHNTAGGLKIHDQPSRRFGLSYRTLKGNDTQGTSLGYVVHILYQLLAIPGSESFETLGSEITPVEFSWELSGVPVDVPGYKATVHMSLDSTQIDPEKLENIEDILYGTGSSAPRLPTPEELIAILEGSYVILIQDHGDGTWTAYGPDDQIIMTSPTEFEIIDVDGVFLDADTYEITTTYT